MIAQRIRPTLIAASMVAAFCLPSLIAVETKSSGAERSALTAIMRGMSRNMQIIADGIAREDWALIAETAPLIADHPRPPLAEKMRILGMLGADATKFKGHDQQTNRAAHDLHQAASRQDGIAVIAAYQRLQTACFDCHRTFRDRFAQGRHTSTRLPAPSSSRDRANSQADPKGSDKQRSN